MATLFRRSSGIYYIVYEQEGGKRRWTSTGQKVKQLALEVLRDFEQNHTYAPPKILLSKFIEDFLQYAKSEYSAKTLAIYTFALNRLLTFIGNVTLLKVSTMQIDCYKSERLRHVSPVSVNVELRTLKAAFNTALRWKLLVENPCSAVSLMRIPEKEPLYFSKADYEILLSCVKEDWFKDLIRLAVFTGLRRAELANLTWNDVDFASKLVHIRSKDDFRTKAGKRRSVPLNQIAEDTLVRRYAVKGDTVFVFERGRRKLSAEPDNKNETVFMVV